MGVQIQAGTTALHESDSAVLAAQNPAGTSTTAQRGENRTDEEPNQDCQQLGVIPSPKTNSLTSGRLVCYKVVWSCPGALAPRHGITARGPRSSGWGWGDAAAARGEKWGFGIPIRK